MNTHRGAVLVTGGLGCIGSWTVRALLVAGIPTVAFDSGDDTRRLRSIAPDSLFANVRLVKGDLTDLHAVETAVADNGVDRIVHLAALQLPFCRMDPPHGALVNVVGTANVFEAARRAGIRQIAYTSSLAIFDRHTGRIDTGALPLPATHYGVYKLSNEGTARAYWEEFGVTSIGIRPMTVYGPGRDRGLTSSPSRAILAGFLGCRYEIGFGGRTLFHYAGDVATALVAAVQAAVAGAHVVNLNGVSAPVTDIVTSLRRIVGTAADGITVAADALPFPDDAETAGLEIIGPPPVTPLHDGVAATVDFFRDLDREGRLDPGDHGLTVENRVAGDIETAGSTA